MVGVWLDSAHQARPEAVEPIRRSPEWLWAAAVLLGLALVLWQVSTAGSWLDEYWQLWISGAPTGALIDRLVADAHPPWFNLFARAIVFVTGGAIVPSRLVNLLTAIVVLGVGLWRMSGLDPALRWRILLLIVASGGAVGMTVLAASFRVYPWLLVLAGLQAAMLSALALKRPVPTMLAAGITAVSVALHYVHAVGAIAIAMVSLAVAWRHDRSAFRAILVGLVVGVGLDLVSGLTQLPHWRGIYDVNWIGESRGVGGRLATLSAVGVNFVAGNVIATALLALAAITRRNRVMLLLLAPIPLAVVGWIILDSVTPMLIPRYMASVTALLAAAAAVAWWELALAPIANAGLAFLAALQPLASRTILPPLAGWEAGARIAAGVAKACPGGALYAVSPWRFRDHPESHTARFEEPVIRLAYDRVGRSAGLAPQLVTNPKIVESARCPAIVWIESAHGIDRVPVSVILRRAQLRVPPGATTKVVATPNGAVLLISPADRLHPRP
jgi:hypothetical protein